MKRLIVTLLCVAATTHAQRVVLEGATVFPVSSEPIENGVVIVDDGVIAHVGPAGSGERNGASTVDLSGYHLYPGLIAPTSSLGLTEIASVPATDDVREMGDHNARLHAYRAVNPDSELIPTTRSNGVTHANVVPGGSLVRGYAGLLALDGWTWEDRLVGGANGLHLSWPSMRLRRGDDAPALKEQKTEREQRIADLHTLLDDARAYLAAADAQGERGAEPTDRDLEFEAWRPVLDRELPLFVHASDARQIEAALAFCDEENLRLVIVDGREAPRVADLLAQADVAVILEAVMRRPAYDHDHPWVGYERAARLHEAGVRVAISVGSGGWLDTINRNLPFHAGMARAHGLPDEAALASITSVPAEILGVGESMGTIEVGKRAHLIATTGDVLDIRSRVERMWIDGDEVDLDDRHKRLFRKYSNRPRPGVD